MYRQRRYSKCVKRLEGTYSGLQSGLQSYFNSLDFAAEVVKLLMEWVNHYHNNLDLIRLSFSRYYFREK